MISYSLPYPPTVNGLFVEVAGKRIKTRSYREWRTEAGWAVLAQGKMRITGKVLLLIECVAPDKRRRDIDNLIKGVLDLLGTKHGVGVIEDDSMVMEVRARWISQGPPCRVQIVHSPAELDPIDLLAPAQ